MKNIKIIIIILVILLLISLTALLIILNNYGDTNTHVGDQNTIAESGPQDTPIDLNEYIEEETNYNVVFAVDDYINVMLELENDSNSEVIMQMVSNYQMIEQMNIKDKQSIFYIQEIYARKSLERVSYFVRGILRNINEDYTEDLSEVYFKVDIDYATNAALINALDKDTYEQEIHDTESTVEDFNIELNDYNSFEQGFYTTEMVCNKYLSDFIIKLKYDRELAFEFVDDEYKEQKFNNDLSAFNEYINNNQDRLYNVTIQRYLKDIKENSIEYTILDTYGNYYIIDCAGGLDYKIMLDNYTIETEEFISAYEQASEQEKVTTNISKVVQSINTKDYEQIYNKLDATFRQNNFSDLDTFETYMQENFFSFNNMEVQSIEKISDNYVCEVTLSSGYGVASEQTTKTFIMQLKEGTDFVMSFTV